MTGFYIISVREMIKAFQDLEDGGENKLNAILSTFSCTLNPDIEFFLHKKSVLFENQSLSRTFLVMASFQNNPVIAGYFALAMKQISIRKEAVSNKMRSRIRRFAQFDTNSNSFFLPAILVAQLGKNDTYKNLISGDELLYFALEKVKEIQNLAGGKLVYVECEDVDKLKRFYYSNGFVEFGKRDRMKDEIGKIKSSYLVQMIKYMK